jgi:hypothetical protein
MASPLWAQEIPDQSQTMVDHGFWFEDDVIRWQEFIPTLRNVTRVDLYVVRTGNPGDVITQLRTVGDTVLGEVTIPESSIPSAGWVTARFGRAIPVQPGDKYRVYVYSTQDSPNPDNRYAWMGSHHSGFCPPCLNDVIDVWPDYDYAFTTYGTQGCFPTAALSGEPTGKRQLDDLHRFRDTVLASSPVGRGYISLFYRHSPEIADMLLADADLRAKVAEVLTEYAPAIRWVLGDAYGRDMLLTPFRTGKLALLLDQIQVQASPGLQSTIDELRGLLSRSEGKSVQQALTETLIFEAAPRSPRPARELTQQ